MPVTMHQAPPACQAQTGVPPREREDKSLVLMLREAIDECGWKHDAVAEAIGVAPWYLSKMLACEKAITQRHLKALPDDIEAMLAQKWCEAFGLIVITPLEGPAAVKAFASGLIGMFATQLPERASRMAKSGPMPAAARTKSA